GLGLSQRALADRLAEHGRPMQVSGVSKIEAGERRVDVDDLVALARALEVTPAHLLTGEPDPMQTDLDELRQHSKALSPIGRAVFAARKAGVSFHTIIGYLHVREQFDIEAGVLEADDGEH